MPAAARGRTVTGVDKPWRDAIRLAVNREVGEGKEKQKLLNVLASKLVRIGVEGDVSAIKEIGDRLDGKSSQPLTGDPDNPIAVADVSDTEAARRIAALLTSATK